MKEFGAKAQEKMRGTYQKGKEMVEEESTILS